MISKVECVVIECDGCGEILTDSNDFSIFPDDSTAKEKISDEDWYTTDDGKHYCHECHHIDDNDQLCLHPKKAQPLDKNKVG